MIKSRSLLRLATLATLVLYCTSLPVPDPNPSPALDDRPEIIEIIAPAQAAQETLDSLSLGDPNAEGSERSKRTIGILRQLFPGLSQIIEQKIQSIVSFLIRTVGRSLLSGALGGGSGSGGATGTSSEDSDSGDRVSIALPGIDSDEDEDDDEDDEDTDDTDGGKAPETSSRPSLDNRFKEDNETSDEVQTSNLEDKSSSELSGTTANNILSSSNNENSHPQMETVNNSSPSSDNESTSSPTESISSPELTSESADSSSLSSTLESVTSDDSTATVASLATAVDNQDSENQLAGAESQQNDVRVQFTDASQKDADAADGDQEGAASDNDGLALDDIDASDENRDKRFLGGDSSGGSSSGGGSGNFLFDIIRRPAEGMARAAGQAFRILTGTDSIGLGITATHTSVRDVDNTNKLVAGSGGTEQSDEANNATADHDGSGKTDASYSEGIPGPVTRLFIIANRGIANLIQDLILRLAQTSERIVNFKARLITSII